MSVGNDSEETEALVGGGDGGEGPVAGLRWRGSQAGTWRSLRTCCVWTLLWVQEDCFLLPSSPRLPGVAPSARSILQVGNRCREETAGRQASWPAACALDQRTAGMTAALGSHRNELTSFPPACGQVLPCPPVRHFRLRSQTWELSHRRGSVSG